MTEVELFDAPSDGITAVNYAPSIPTRLLASSWDGTVRMYDTKENILLQKFDFTPDASQLDACFDSASDSVGYSGGLDSKVYCLNLDRGTSSTLSQHQSAVRSVVSNSETNAIFTGSWDKTVQVLDPRSANARVHTIQLPERVYSMDTAAQRIVVGMADRKVYVYDARKLPEPEQMRESALKFQTRCVRCFPDATGYALSSIEGRVAIEYFDPTPEVQAKRYAFKCHRESTADADVVYPVNALAFHPTYGTFASGGCDGIINIWDGRNKKRLTQWPKYDTSIASMCFNSDGSEIAVAVSYTFERGDVKNDNEARPKDRIVIRSIVDSEVQPKSRKK